MSANPNWLLFKKGDQNAFEKIYREYIVDLYAYGKKISKDENIVKDCIQDMFLDLWNKREKLGDTDNIKAYIFTVLRRRIIKTLRKESNISLLNELELFQTELAIDIVLEKQELNKEQVNKLKNAFESLTKNQQHILYLKYYQNFNNKEISEILKINYQSTRNALNRALIALRKNISMLIIFLLIK